MPPEPFPDSSNSHENDQKVRFVDTDLSIQPSHHGAPDKENEANERGADKYYKDMQSIHGDTVPPLHHSVSVIPLFRRLHFESHCSNAMLSSEIWEASSSCRATSEYVVTLDDPLQAAKRRAITELLFFASVGDLRRCQRIVRLWKLKVHVLLAQRICG